MDLYPGQRLFLAYFGFATIRRFYMVDKVKELIADVKTDNGQYLYLSPAYCRKCAVKG